MNSITLAALFSLVLFVSTYRFEYSSPSLRLLEELETELALGELGLPRSRPRRVPGPGAKACGKHIVKYVMSVCGGACEAGSGIDLATRCCGTQCDEDFIRTACCPK